MSISFNFNFYYNTFYNYYSNLANLQQIHTPISTTYYKKNMGVYHPYNNILTHYITIGGTQIFITIRGGNKGILHFTIPKNINGIFYDDHYHFGIEPKYDPISKRKNVMTVFFHKTDQDPVIGASTKIDCWFEDGINMSYKDIDKIICR